MSRTVISSTDIIKQIRELQDDVSTIVETYNDDAREAAFQEDADHEQYEDIEVDTSEVGELKDFMELLVDTDDKAKIEELISLLEAAEEAEGYNSDWRHGADLIPSYYFRSYIREYAEETSGIDFNVWPCNNIDWVDAAKDMEQGFAEIDFNGQSYYIRCT